MAGCLSVNPDKQLADLTAFPAAAVECPWLRCRGHPGTGRPEGPPGLLG